MGEDTRYVSHQAANAAALEPRRSAPVEWALHQEPHRHYKVNTGDKWSWQNRDKTRIASVTTVLDGDTDWLLSWAVGKALVAAEAAMNSLGKVRYLLEDEDFGELCEATGLMPNTYRDLKGGIGTAGHEYLEWRLRRLTGRVADPQCALPYGYRRAIDAFLDETGFVAVVDDRGPRVERAVGDEARAVAGTYDAQGRVGCGRFVLESAGPPPLEPIRVASSLHRIDLKSSNTLQPKMLAQLACYERLAVLCGEDRSDYLTIIHIDACGNWTPTSIPTGGPEEEAALAYFDAALVLYRRAPELRKLLSSPYPLEPGDS